MGYKKVYFALPVATSSRYITIWRYLPSIQESWLHTFKSNFPRALENYQKQYDVTNFVPYYCCLKEGYIFFLLFLIKLQNLKKKNKHTIFSVFSCMTFFSLFIQMQYASSIQVVKFFYNAVDITYVFCLNSIQRNRGKCTDIHDSYKSGVYETANIEENVPTFMTHTNLVFMKRLTGH